MAENVETPDLNKILENDPDLENKLKEQAIEEPVAEEEDVPPSTLNVVEVTPV